MNFEIYPAIDVRGGKVVRLRKGDPTRAEIFGDDPVAIAARWIAEGARWLHVVHLDGAFEETPLPSALLESVCALGARVQVGGGLRTLQDIERALACGAARVIVGTISVENPNLIAQAIARWGAEKIAVGIDARAGRVRVRGWQRDARVNALDLARQMRARGVERIIFTDIERDGMLRGANVESAARLAHASGLRVIVSGGVAMLKDVHRARAAAERGVEGVIIGRALYQGAVNLQEAMC